jgi:enoyl-CoA hydratase/carnithine racemase
MSNQLIFAKQENAVYQIIIDRPDKMNALTDAMYGDLVSHLKAAEADNQIRVVLIRSSGKHFSAGNDLADFLKTEFNLESNVVQFLLTLAQMTKPLIAAVNGAAVGIGTTMLLHCDLVYAASDAKFSVPFIKLGLTPEGGSTKLMAERCGVLNANDWLLTGRKVLADEAHRAGLVNAVFDSTETLWQGALNTAERMAKNSQRVLLESKRLIKGDQIADVVNVIKKEADIFGECLQSPEAKAAFEAFLNK